MVVLKTKGGNKLYIEIYIKDLNKTFYNIQDLKLKYVILYNVNLDVSSSVALFI